MRNQEIQPVAVTEDTVGLKGHFPGIPLVPAALQLEWMLEAVEAVAGAVGSFKVFRARFLVPVRPGMLVERRVVEQGTLRYRVQLIAGASTCAEARIEVVTA